MNADLRLVPGPPTLEDYLALRAESGLSPKTREQGLAGLAGSWSAVHVRHEPSGRSVGMGRVIGDGGWYFHVVDMAVRPPFQRQGIGDAVLTHLLEEIRHRAPAGAYISLLADAPGRPLYSRHGFVETAPRSIGMWLPPDVPGRQGA
jgi:ribosomal protein S18 acetylase RimI-like enzyme